MKAQTLKYALLSTIAVILLICLIALGDYLIQLGRSKGSVPPGTESQIGGTFSLINQAGQAVSEKDYSDRYKLIFLGFTHCPDVCPTTLSRMTQVIKQLGPLSEKLYPLFITVDPERDTPERLMAYSKNFDPQITYLTGSKDEIAKVLKSWKASRAKIAARSGKITESNYSMSHSSVLYLMSPDGRLIEAYSWEVSTAALAQSLRKRISP